MPHNKNSRRKSMTDLKSFREQNRIKQIELSSFAGLTQARLSYLENGWYSLSDKEKDKLIAGYAKLGIDASKEITKIFNKQK